MVHVCLAFSDDYRELGDEPYGILKIVKEAGAFRRGSWGAEMSPTLNVKESDVMVDGKCTIDTFASTNLELVLGSRGVRTLALAGMLTDLCVESTMRAAYDKGYEVYTVTDCTATLSAERRKSAVESDFPMFSTPVTHAGFLSRLNRS